MRSCNISPYVIPAIKEKTAELFVIPNKSQMISVKVLVKVITEVFQVTKEQLYSKSRVSNILLAKYCMRWYCAKYIKMKPRNMRYEFKLSYEAIARSIKLVPEICETDKTFREKFQKVKTSLKGHLISIKQKLNQ